MVSSGLKSRCRKCQSEDHKLYMSSDGAKENKKKYQRKYLESGRFAISRDAYEKRNQIKVIARRMLYNALRRGDVEKRKDCEKCHSKGKIQGHHCDYSKPLEVNWLCRPCHNEWHRLNGKGING